VASKTDWNVKRKLKQRRIRRRGGNAYGCEIRREKGNGVVWINCTIDH
jgi:hypothetical protein